MPTVRPSPPCCGRAPVADERRVLHQTRERRGDRGIERRPPRDDGLEHGHLVDQCAERREVAAQDVWVAGFQRANASVTVNYDPAGSGAGREQFLVGAVGFAGSDTALSIDETESDPPQCAEGSGAVVETDETNNCIASGTPVTVTP